MVPTLLDKITASVWLSRMPLETVVTLPCCPCSTAPIATFGPNDDIGPVPLIWAHPNCVARLPALALLSRFLEKSRLRARRADRRELFTTIGHRKRQIGAKARKRRALACQMGLLACVAFSSLLRPQLIDSKGLASEYFPKNRLLGRRSGSRCLPRVDDANWLLHCSNGESAKVWANCAPAPLFTLWLFISQ